MKIGLSQRVEIVPNYGERRDCLDQNWPILVKKLGFTPIPISNVLKTPDDIKELELDGVILTGGNDLSSLVGSKNAAVERDETEIALLKFAEQHSLPILGVCRGCQLINVFLKGSLNQCTNHVGLRHKVNIVTENSLFAQYSEVNSFHNWGIKPENMAPEIVPAVLDNDGFIEGFFHKKLPWVGIMWHPEREKPFVPADIDLIRNILGRLK